MVFSSLQTRPASSWQNPEQWGEDGGEELTMALDYAPRRME